MDWSQERYVRVYTRDTVEWCALPWQSKALWLLLLRKLDRIGSIDLGRTGIRSLAPFLGIPQEIVDLGLPDLIDNEIVEQIDGRLIAKNFIEAQESKASPTQRQREYRERERDRIRAGIDKSQRGTVIYFIQSEHGGPVKIGRADDVAKRLQGLQTGRPDKLVLLAAAPGTVADERIVHRKFNHYREKGEWFSFSEEVREFINLVNSTGSVTGDSCDDTSHDSSTVTPNRTVPCLAVPSVTKESEPLSAGADGGVVGASSVDRTVVGGGTQFKLDVGPPLVKPNSDQLPEEALLWNDIASPDFGKVKAMNDERRQKLRELRKVLPNLDDWRAAIFRLNSWPFAHGENATGWIAGFDYLLSNDKHKNSNLLALAEGAKGGEKQRDVTRGHQPVGDWDAWRAQQAKGGGQ